MAKLKKEDLVALLVSSMTDEQWNLIALLRGQPVPSTVKKKENFLNGLFHKTISRDHAKSKSRNLQQWACKKISEFSEIPWGKDEEIASREMGQSGPDVRMSPNARKIFPFTLECKSGNQWNLPASIKQCQANLYPDTRWMVVLDRPDPKPDNRIPPVVVVDGELFFEIWSESLASRLGIEKG